MERMVLTSNTQNTKGERSVSYFADKPEVVKIFEDLEKFRNFCRFEGYRFNERDLYNDKARTYRAFLDPAKARKERRERKAERLKNRSNKRRAH
jgi:hypothetical protein